MQSKNVKYAKYADYAKHADYAKYAKIAKHWSFLHSAFRMGISQVCKVFSFACWSFAAFKAHLRRFRACCHSNSFEGCKAWTWRQSTYSCFALASCEKVSNKSEFQPKKCFSCEHGVLSIRPGVPDKLTGSNRSLKLYWCDSGLWRYLFNTNYILHDSKWSAAGCCRRLKSESDPWTT